MPRAIALNGDERRLRRCVVNLLANAVKFARRGDGVGNRVGIEIRVADTCCGIPDHQLERVFEPFHLVENELGPHHQRHRPRPPAQPQAGGAPWCSRARRHAILSLPGRAVGLDGEYLIY